MNLHRKAEHLGCMYRNRVREKKKSKVIFRKYALATAEVIKQELREEKRKCSSPSTSTQSAQLHLALPV